MRSELGRIQHELQAQQETIKENEKKIKQNKTLPYLVSNIIEVLDINPEEEEEIEGKFIILLFPHQMLTKKNFIQYR